MNSVRPDNGSRPGPAEVMVEIGRRAASSEGLSEVAAFAVEQLAGLLQADYAALLQIDRGSLLPIATHGWQGALSAALEGDRVRVDADLASEAGVDPLSWLTADVMGEGRRWAVLAVHKPAGARRLRDLEAAVAAVALILQSTRQLELTRRRLGYVLNHDTLTGLPNRQSFVERVRDARLSSPPGSVTRAVICIGMDRFLQFNNAVGYAAGDRHLQDAAARLRRALRPGDAAARQTSDRFLVLADGLPSEGAARAEAERLRRSVTGAVRVGSREMLVGASAGVALDDHDTTTDELLWESELAMFKAKNAGRNQVAVFEPSFHDRLSVRRHLEVDLRDALDHDGLVMHYQPIVDLTDGGVLRAEGLIRWLHPQRGLLAPADFMPLADQSRLEPALTDWVLNTACAQARKWSDLARANDVTAPGVAVNLSARELAEAGLVQRVSYALDRAHLPAGQLTLEVSEAVMLSEPDRLAATMRQLHELGVQLSIDDFGTGYFSLAHLRRFPADTLKIDSPYIAGLGIDANDSVVVAGILALARALGVQAVAEGVETRAQAEELDRLGCHVAQGFLFAKPEPHDALWARISAGSHQGVGAGRRPALLPDYRRSTT